MKPVTAYYFGACYPPTETPRGNPTPYRERAEVAIEYADDTWKTVFRSEDPDAVCLSDDGQALLMQQILRHHLGENVGLDLAQRVMSQPGTGLRFTPNFLDRLLIKARVQLTLF